MRGKVLAGTLLVGIVVCGAGLARQTAPDEEWLTRVRAAMAPEGQSTPHSCVILIVLDANDPFQRPRRNLDMAETPTRWIPVLWEQFSHVDPWLARWRLTRLPTLVVIDRYGNAFGSVYNTTAGSLRQISRVGPPAVDKFQAKLKVLGEKLEDEASRSKAAREIAAFGRWGYPEIERALEMLRNEWEEEKKAFDLLEGDSLDEANRNLKRIESRDKENPLGVLASIEWARRNFKTETRAALNRLEKVIDLEPKIFQPELIKAREMMEKIEAFGFEQLEALGGEADRAALLRVKREFEGTAVEKAAAKKLESIR